MMYVMCIMRISYFFIDTSNHTIYPFILLNSVSHDAKKAGTSGTGFLTFE
jgi:hypothetical protein